MSHGITDTDRVLLGRGLQAWHHLGDVRQILTIDDAIAALAWRTELVALQTAEPNPQAVPMSFANRREDTGEILATVGSKFRDLQNSDAIEGFRPWVETGVLDLDTAGTLHGGRRIFVSGRLAIDPIALAGGDTTEVWVTLVSSHDDTMSPTGVVCGIRPVCHNTVTATLGCPHAFKVRKTGDVAAKVADALAEIEVIKAGVDRMRRVATDLAEIPVPGEGEQRDDRVLDYLAAVFQETPADLAGMRKAGAIADLFDGAAQGSHLASADGTWWGLYQSLTEYYTHQHGRSADNRFDSALVGTNAGYIRRGVSVAYVMAKGIDVDLALGTGRLEEIVMAHAGVAA